MSEFEVPNGEYNYYLYFLKLFDGYYYVGISKNIYHRLRQHKNGDGSSVTKAHRPIQLIGVWDLGIMSYLDAEQVEDEFTIYFMSMYGGKVRGGSWSKKKQNVEAVLQNKAIYSPCECYEMVDINFGFKKPRPKKRKRKVKKEKRPKIKFKTRQEQVEWICRGKR